MKGLLEVLKALYSIKDAINNKKNNSSDDEGGGNTDSKNLFLGYNIPDKLLYYEYTEDDEHGYPIENNVYFDSFQEAIQYLELKGKISEGIGDLVILYKDLTLDARNCYSLVHIENSKYEGQYEFNFVKPNSTSFDTEHPFIINGENYYEIDDTVNNR